MQQPDGVVRAAAAAEGGYDAWASAARPQLLRLAASVLADPAEADDVVQDVLLGLWRNQRFEKVANLDGYARRSVVNACRDRARHSRRDRARGVELRRIYEQQLRESDLVHDIDVDVWAAVKQLKPADQEVLTLRYVLDLGDDDIALALGCRRGTVRTRAARALRRLARHLDLTPDPAER